MKTVLIIAGALVFLSGMAYGLHETLVHHPGAFAERYPQAGLYWRAADDCDDRTKESWVLKYKDHNPQAGPAFIGSTTALVFLTDAKHLFSSLHLWLMVAGVVLASPRFTRRPLDMAALFFGLVVLRAAGFHLVYSIYF